MVSVPLELAYQVPFVPQDGGVRLMLDPLMSSMSSPDAGPVQKLAAALASDAEVASTEMLVSAGRSAFASATTCELVDEAQPPMSTFEIIPAVAQPTITATACSAHIRFMGHSLLSSSNTANHVVETSAPPDAVPAYDGQIGRPSRA